MKRTLCVSLAIAVSVALGFIAIVPAGAPAANSNMGTWQQTDWSQGPGQALWQNSAMYNSASGIDTMSAPGKMRLSFLCNPFTKDPGNPVLKKGGVGSFDEIYVRGFPIKRSTGGYQILYDGTDASAPNNLTAIGYAGSPDGVTWTKSPNNPVLRRSGTAAWDQNGVMGYYHLNTEMTEEYQLVKAGGTYHLYFQGDDGAGDGGFGHATSSDLKTWSRGNSPVLGAGPVGSWDAQRIGHVKAFLVGSTFHIWYIGESAGGVLMQLGHATSTDGEHWVKDPANPVLSPGAPGSFDDVNILDFVILPRPWAGSYLLAYLGSSVGGFGVGIATSPDGTHWTKDPANPKFSTATAPAWCTNNIGPQTLTFDGSRYKMMLYGNDATNATSSGEAASDDGTTWAFNTANPLITPGAPGAWDSAAAWAGHVYLEGNTVRVFYDGHFPFPCWTVGTATSAPTYGATGTMVSSVYDALGKVGWGSISWSESKPAGTAVKIELRNGDKPVPDASWTGWTVVSNGGAIPLAPARYIQYRATLTTSNAHLSPEVSDISLKAGKTWYLAEGSTGINAQGAFESWVLVQNPGDTKAEVDLFYQTPAGEKKGPHLSMNAHSRSTVNIADTVPNEFSVSTRVVADNPVIAERAMYWNTPGAFRQAATDSIGVPGPASTWYLAEGSTGINAQGAFESWVLVQNPGDTKAEVDLFYQTPAGEKKGPHLSMNAHSRSTVNIADTVPNEFSVSTRVVADNPVIAERAMYWNTPGAFRQAATDSIGVPGPASTWYLAEGSTGINAQGAFESWVLVQNPGDTKAEVDLFYQTPAGEKKGPHLSMNAHSRSTVNIADTVPNEFSVSTRVVADNPVIAERAMYWNTPGAFRQAATDSIGVPGPASTWYLAEGSTGINAQGAFESWVLVQNPGDTKAEVDLFYQTPAGEKKGPHLSMNAHSRSTVNIADTVPNEFSVSTRVVADNPVIAERAMYWNTPGAFRQAATDSIGFDP